MAEESGWGFEDIENLSEDQLLRVFKQLKGSKHRDVQLKLQKEFIRRARACGLSSEKIINILTWGVSQQDRNEIAEDWAKAIGVSINKFKKIASGK